MLEILLDLSVLKLCVTCMWVGQGFVFFCFWGDILNFAVYVCVVWYKDNASCLMDCVIIRRHVRLYFCR